ncbi:unnamed protein product [Caenorhabditis angaria]|uniref:FXNA-like protease n=1 Tax=Caenorhabditis angaria TaxID=860376 RepID=A0A9P1IAH0_9PELO|nr:unnamed protein product [Caenorhabditis angaria]
MSSEIRRRPGLTRSNYTPLVNESENEKSQKIDQEECSNQLKTQHWALIFIYLGIIILGACHLHTCMPQPKEPNSDDVQFSETRAAKILEELSDYGWKPAGSYNCEVLARNRILRELQEIQKTSISHFDIETQYVSGCFDIPAHDTEGMNICYRNVSNVIARLGAKKYEGKEIAVLLNCHYDSYPTSSAGSDDLSSCALMLELIRIYAKHPVFLNHNIIFLFNGAEESSLLAAHGFITQHPWRHQIRAFINLEASGSGGRELLFQAGPANQWLLNSYLEAAVHPHCSVLGQEVFQSGVYPGDTDFRIFRDHGRIPGLDLAFVQNGYWYHTEFDEAKRITKGSLQRAGENVFAVINHLMSAPYLESPAEYTDHKSVFFDFLGLFVVIYPLSFAHVLNVTIVLASLFFAANRVAKNSWIFFIALRDYIIITISMLFILFVMSKMSVFTYGALRWYTRQWLALIAYGFPTIWAGLTVQSLLSARRNPKSRKEYAACLEVVHLVFLSGILVVFTYYNIASGFIFTLLCLPILKIVVQFLGFIGDCPTLQTLLTLLLSFPGLSMSIYTTEMLLTIFIPIMGRTPTNPELVVGIFVFFSSFNIVMSLIGLTPRSRNSRDPSETRIGDFIYTIFGVILATLTVLLVFASIWPSPFRFDERYPTAKRTQFFHTNQLFYNRDGSVAVNESRLYAISLDFRGPEDIPFVKSDPEYTMISCFYPNNPFCEVPYLFPNRGRINEKNMRVRKLEETPKFPKSVKILQISKKRGEIDGAACIDYRFSVIGTSQISVYLIPDSIWAITNTSVSAPEIPQHDMFLYFTCSNPSNLCEWIFDVQIRQISHEISDDKPLLVGVSNHYLHGPHMLSKTLTNLREKVFEMRPTNPEWTINPSAWNVDQVYRHF